MNTLDQMAEKIIKEQELVIGPLAWSEAEKVNGLQIVDQKKGDITIQNGNPKDVINRLVAQYERLFGRASHEVCKDAVKNMLANLAPADVPSSLLV